MKIETEYDYFDWHDHDKVAKLQKKRSMMWLRLYKKMIDARDIGDANVLTTAKENLQKHEKVDLEC